MLHIIARQLHWNFHTCFTITNTVILPLGGMLHAAHPFLSSEAVGVIALEIYNEDFKATVRMGDVQLGII